jgi:tetratricopeptide (TPR) repeat protein
MARSIIKLLFAIALVSFGLTSIGCGALWSMPAPAEPPAPAIPAAKPVPSDEKIIESSIRFLEDRVKDNPVDFPAYNKLAGYYLKLMHQTGSMNYLDLASQAVKASLEIAPKDLNPGGLSLLAEIEFTSHDFAAARDDAKLLIKIDPKKLPGYQLLADSLLELGDYKDAAAIYTEMERLSDYSDSTIISIAIRLARLELLYGKTEAAKRYYSIAVATATDSYSPSRETIAWCRLQLGETFFSVGDYETAEKHYREALTTFPDYFRVLASLGRLLAAKGDLSGAIEQYERAIRINPDPVFIAALGDLYKLSGREREAAAQYALVEQIARLSALNGNLYNRQLALFYADHGQKTEEAYSLASKEYQVRRDIYGADAVAWTALKAGKIEEAKTAMKEALKLGTQDARLFYHAGMIARAAGDKDSARSYLEKALKLNPQFDPLQSSITRKVLGEF